jgi:hypothetical protein
MPVRRMPLACMSRITARVVSLDADRAARALATVSAATRLPSFVPLALAAARAALVRSLMRRASPSGAIRPRAPWSGRSSCELR